MVARGLQSSVMCHVAGGFEVDVLDSVTSYFLRSGGINYVIPPERAHNVLEEADYDRTHGVDPAHSLALASRYLNIAGASAETPVKVLEVGCGTGNLTVGLDASPQVAGVLAVDISGPFLETTRDRLAAAAQSSSRTALLCADLNDDVIAPESFDAIFGNSIIHHIFDVERLLTNLHKALKPGGVMIFNEPCQQGKSMISFLLGSIITMESGQPDRVFSDDDLYRMGAVLQIHKRELLARDNPAIKLEWEDKHIFETEAMADMAHRLGFASFRSENTEQIVDGFRKQTETVLRIMGIEKPLDRYGFLFAALQSEYVSMCGSSIQTPHQFLIFVK